MKGFILRYKDGTKKGYTTLSAIYEDNTKEELGVSKYTLDRYDFSTCEYENDKCTIEVLEFKTKGDIIREREQFI